MTEMLFPGGTHALAGHILNATFEGTLLVACVWLLLRFVGRQSSRTRFAIWFLALLAVAVLPIAAGMSSRDAGILGKTEFTLPASWANYLLFGWLAGFVFTMLRLFAGLWRLQQIKRGSVPLDVNPALAKRMAEGSGGRKVSLLVSDEITLPAAFGFLAPAVLLPKAILPQLSADELEVILLHEFAHLRRWDDWSNLAQKLVKSLFFFHPAVWWVESRLNMEREMACDDLVVSEIASARKYASFLINFTEKTQHSKRLALVQGLASRMGQMSLRVAEILKPKSTSRIGHRGAIVGCGAALAVLVFGVVPLAPEFIAFREPRQVASAKLEGIHRDVGQPVHSASVSRANSTRMIPAAFKLDAPKTTARPAVHASSATHESSRLVWTKAPQPKPAVPAVLIVFQEEDGIGDLTTAVWHVCVYQYDEERGTSLRWQSIVLKL